MLIEAETSFARVSLRSADAFPVVAMKFDQKKQCGFSESLKMVALLRMMPWGNKELCNLLVHTCTLKNSYHSTGAKDPL